jgi:GT2 family glycosyltransferase
MIYYSTPWSSEKDLGKAYNDFMNLLPNDNDYACFTDADAMFTTHTFGHQLEDIVKEYPEAPLFTAMTNRVGTDYQLAKVSGAWEENNIARHWAIGKILQETYPYKVEDITHCSPLSGVLILIRKKEWKECGGFKEGIGMLGVDNSIHYRIRDKGYPVLLMKGVYILHYYRNGKAEDKNHLL